MPRPNPMMGESLLMWTAVRREGAHHRRRDNPLGEHCAGAFAIVGATHSELNGLYNRINHTCHGKPVYQKGGRDGYMYVLYRPGGYSEWDVSTSDHATSCH
eukprot:COSAG02_NODE_25416_length_659_cov_1.339286_1_plen_100_part_10